MKVNLKKLLFALTLTVLFCVFSSVQTKAAGPYLIKINKQQCVVTIYKKDKKGEYKIPIKAMLCSPGKATPLGSFGLKEKIRWHELDGPCYGQYCSRINGGILFHSVWYYKPEPSMLACAQYNNLGYQVSHGCVRLTVRDAKWIFDNCPSGTTVEIYESKNPGPLGKPVSIKVPGYMNWDPTDTGNPNNPWNKKKPTITGAKNQTIIFGSKYNITKGLKVKNTTGYNSIKLLKTKISFKSAVSSKLKTVKKVNTKKPGKYKIMYQIIDEIGRKAKVTVTHRVLSKVNVGRIVLNRSKKVLYLGGTKNQKTVTLKVKKIEPKTASIKTVQIKSDNKRVATVTKKGIVKAKKAGTCTITFLAMDGSGTKATCKITVKQIAQGLELIAPSDKLYVGEPLILQTNYSPKNTSNQRTRYTSSDNMIATVSDTGVVTGLKSGSVTITAQTMDGSGKSTTIRLNVLYKYKEVVNGPEKEMNLSLDANFADEMSKLPSILTIKDAYGNLGSAIVTWDTSEYVQGNTTCNVYGDITLPNGWVDNNGKNFIERYKIIVTQGGQN